MILASQILWHRVLIDVADPDAARELQRMYQRAEHQRAPVASVRLTVSGDATNGYRIADGDDMFACVPSPRAVLDEVFARTYRRAFELASLKGWVRFHGAVATVAGRRLAIVGASGAGKTTMAVALLARGHAVETDESFVARHGEVLGVSRRLHVKDGPPGLVAGTTWLPDAPILDARERLRVVDPSDHGFAWQLPVGPVDAIVVVERTGECSGIEPVGAGPVIQGLIAESFPVVEPRAAVVREATNLVRGRATHVLRNGPDGHAPRLLVDLASRRSAAPDAVAAP